MSTGNLARQNVEMLLTILDKTCNGDIVLMISALSTATAVVTMSAVGNNRAAAEAFIDAAVIPTIVDGFDIVEMRGFGQRKASH